MNYFSKRSRVALAATFVAALVATLGVPKTARAAIFPVSNTAELLAAVSAANANPGQDTIILAPGVYPITTVAETVDITDDLIMFGSGPGPSVLEGPGPAAPFIDILVVEANVAVELRDFTIRNSSGSGIDNLGTLVISGMTFAGNNTAVENRTAPGVLPEIHITNTTISDNGVGIFQNFGTGPLFLTNATIAFNDVGLDTLISSPVTAINTIFANNPGGNCDAGPPASSDHSLDSDGTCKLVGPGDRSFVDPRLGPLADNGGLTDTRELLSGSPAIDAGTAVAAPPTDQRGVARVGAVDIGAFEFDPSLSEGAAGATGPGGTVTTDTEGDGATPGDPLETSVTSPTGGSISIEERFSSTGGFELLGWHSQISAPPATPGAPLVIVFRIDASLVPAGQDQNTIQVLKNGTLVADCPGSATAVPDPCISERLLLVDGDVQLTVLTSTASLWTFGVSGVPLLSIGDSTVVEGDAGTTNADFTVTLSPATTQTVTVQFSTHDGTATAPGDYVATNGTLTFNPGETSKTISVAVNGDTIDEADETFTVDLTNAVNATIADGQGVGTIVDDDAPPTDFDVRVEGDGSIETPRRDVFTFKVGFKKGTARGHVNFFDKANKIHLKSTAITSLTCAGTHATIVGTGKVNGSPVNFTLDVSDVGKKGKGDTFSIQLSSPSYSASGQLTKGDIKLKGC